MTDGIATKNFLLFGLPILPQITIQMSGMKKALQYHKTWANIATLALRNDIDP